MDELQRKQRSKRLLYSIPSLCLLTILTFLLAKGALGVLGKERDSADRINLLEAKAAVLTGRQTELEEGIEKLKTEEGITEEIKQKFSVERAGEHVAIIVDEREKASSTGVLEEKSWWGKVKSLWSPKDQGYNASQ